MGARPDNFGERVLRDTEAAAHYTDDYTAENVRIELHAAREERDRVLAAIAARVNGGRVGRIAPEDLERAARLVRTVHLLAPLVDPGFTGE